MLGRLVVFLWASAALAALDVNLDSSDSIKAAAKILATKLMSYYHGNEPGQTPGILPGPPPGGAYYWWEGGALWGNMIDHWHYTGDSTYNTLITDAMLWQVGPGKDYMPPNFTASLGNDDQGFWGMSAMLAAESNFPNPPPDKAQWLALAQAVFHTQAARWETQYCNGGLRWQIPLSNNGYDYKNTIASAIFFNLGARLARYTGDKTYADWAEKTWDWTQIYIDKDSNVFDGGHVQHNCTDINRAQFSYTAGVLIQGLAFMYSHTDGEEKWRKSLESLTKQTLKVFYPQGIAYEPACEADGNMGGCTTDMRSFKGYVHRWLAQTCQMAPFMRSTIMPVLKSSATGAMKSCEPDATCGFRWDRASYDGDTGAGQQMNALGALLSLLAGAEAVPAPVTGNAGGTSVGDPNAGTGPRIELDEVPVRERDRAGAGILTTLFLLVLIFTLCWMGTTSHEGPRWQDDEKGLP